MRLFCLVLVALLGLAFLASAASAATPYILNYQGRLLDDTDTPVSQILDIVYLLYDAPAGGSVLWSVTRTTNVVDGLFSQRLGGDVSNPIEPEWFESGEMYLAVEIGGTEVVRHALGAAPYVLRAHMTDQADQASDANLLQGMSASDFATAIHSHYPTDIVPQGHGSGLDADVIDGHHATYFALADHDHDSYFAPDPHMHTGGDIVPSGPGSGFDVDMLAGLHAGDLADAIHNHNASQFTSGTLSTNVYDAYAELDEAGHIDGGEPDGLITLGNANGLYRNLHHDESVQARFHFAIYQFPNGGPIAYGTVSADATIQSGSGNFTCSWSSNDGGYYLIDVTGISGSSVNYTVLATPAEGSGETWMVQSDGNGYDVLFRFMRHD